MLSEAGFGASSWLRAIPAKWELQICNVDFRICMQWWLHLPLPVLRKSPARCYCWRHNNPDGAAAVADVFGEHDMACKHHDTLHRHNLVCGALLRVARLCGLSARQATVTDLQSPAGSGADDADRSKKQPDVVWTDWHNHGDDDLVDVCVSHPTAASHIGCYSRSVGAGVVAAKIEGAKNSKYGAQAEALGYHFTPFGLETYGTWGPHAVEALGKLVQHAEATAHDNTHANYG